MGRMERLRLPEKVARAGAIFVVAGLVACSAGPSVPDGPNVAGVTVTAAAPVVQIGQTVQLVATAWDAAGNALPDVSFTWASSNESVAAIDGSGRMTAYSVGSVTVTAAAEGHAGSLQMTVVADGDSNFDIEIRYRGEVPARVRTSIATAVARWRSVIVGDVPDVPVSLPAGQCFSGAPAIEESIDDLLLFVETVPLSGFSGFTNVCWVRTAGSLPIVARIQINAADIDRMFREGWGDNLVLHEIGHAIGMLEFIWTREGLTDLSDPNNPLFTGDAAKDAFRSIVPGTTAGSPVPLENVGGPGTIRTHWRRSVLDGEIMSPWVYPSSSLSLLTVTALEDLGFEVDRAAAQPFETGRQESADALNGFEISEGASAPVGSIDVDGSIRIFDRP